MKYLPHGTTFSFASVEIGGLRTVGFPDQTKEEAETTDTYSGGQREFIPGLRDFGTVELVVRHDPEDTGQQALDTNFLAAATIEECIITLPSGATADSSVVTYTFDGFVLQGPQGDLDLADSVAAEATYVIRVTGLVTTAIT